MQNSTLITPRTELFDSKSVNGNGHGVLATVAAGSTANIDLKMLDDNFLTGGMLLTEGANFGDYVCLQVVDIDNVLGYGANTVLGQYITNWYLKSDTNGDQKQFDENMSYPAKVLYGLYLRAIYTSTGASDVKVAVNYKLHKAMY